MSSELAETTRTGKRSLLVEMADSVGLDHAAYYQTMQEMCGCQGASPANFSGLLMVAKQLGLNPITRQLYLMKTQRGVQVVIPIDGYLKLMRAHPDYLSVTCEVGSDEVGGNYAEATIYTKSQNKAGLPPFKHREYMEECKGNSGPWRSHPLRMLKHKAMSQAVRYCFAIYTPDEDEWHRADDMTPTDVGVVDFTPAVAMTPLGAAGEEVVGGPVEATDGPVEPSPAPGFTHDDAPATPEAEFDAEQSRQMDLLDGGA